MDTVSKPPSSRPRRWWAALAVLAAMVPLTPGLSHSRVFYVRDLSLFFWGRYLWLRHAWQAGELPLWDPYVGAGQDAVSDALHQMFLVPSVLVRLIGSDVLGFNLWIAVPFPLAALGTWVFLSRRFSGQGSALAAITFALCGPVYSTTNFPNMSWAVAAIPWVLAAVDALAAAPSPRRLGTLSVAVAMQAFAGEAVTMLATLLLACAYGLTFGVPARGWAWPDRMRRSAWIVAGLGLGVALAAVQLVPMSAAAAASDRAHALHNPLFWSLHPLGLLETVAPHLFGNYFVNQSLAATPWLPVINSGREPFFFSVYVGVPLLTLTALGLASDGERRWARFWACAAAVALIGAFGTHTPIYPFLRDQLPMLQLLRFPAKYSVIAAMALSAIVAAGWDALAGPVPTDTRPRVRVRFAAISVAVLIGLLSWTAIVACLYFPEPTIFRLFALAQRLGSGNPVAAAEFMLKGLPGHAEPVMAMALTTSIFVYFGSSKRSWAAASRAVFFAFIVIDLIARAWPVNPTLEAAYLAQPSWMSYTAAHPDARFYIGGKREGTLDADDPDASRGFLNAPGLHGSASRAALSAQTAFYPSAWRRREMLSYDLAVLWPRAFDAATTRFLESGPDARDRFLRRTGVRYRILPNALAGDRMPLAQMPYYVESYLYDWGESHTPRAAVVSNAAVEPNVERQMGALFAEDWDADTVIVSRAPDPAGRDLPPAPDAARIVEDESNRLRVDANVDAAGGYLVLLDSFSDGWRARVDGMPAEIVRANALFRAVRLRSGHHVVEFVYRPATLMWGAAASGVLSVLVVVLWWWPFPRRAREGNSETA